MGRKKRSLPSPKQAVDSVPPRSPRAEPNKADDYATARAECESALRAFRQGNQSKAVRLMKDTYAKFENSPSASAIVCRVHGAIHFKIWMLIEDRTMKDRLFLSAMDSARRAAELSPNSVEFALFYANLLFVDAEDEEDYMEVIAECERGLRIVCPVDPCEGSFQDESHWRDSTAAERIGQVQDDLRGFIQRSRIDALNIWMRNLEDVEADERFKLIPMRLANKDSVGSRAQRSDEIKAIKDPKEKRKEIEARVAAARLQQQKAEQKGPGGERSGTGRKIPVFIAWFDSLKKYWNSINDDVKEGIFRVRFSEMMEYYEKEKGGDAVKVLKDVANCAGSIKDWRIWECCRCDEKFGDSESLVQHVARKWDLTPTMLLVLPKQASSEWTEMILGFDWKPRDALMATEKDASDPFPTKEKDGEFGRDGSDDVENDEYIPCSVEEEKWPMSDDPECEKLLQRIRKLFKVLIGNKCLSSGQLTEVLHIASEELQELESGSQLLKKGVAESPACMCFLGEYELTKIIKFLQELCQNAGLCVDQEKSIEPLEEAGFASLDSEIRERVVLEFDGDVISIALNSQRNGSPTAECDATEGVAAFVPQDVQSLLEWLFSGPELEDHLMYWVQRKEERMNQKNELFQTIEKEFRTLQEMCQRKTDILGFEEALRSVEDLCINEEKRRGESEEFLPRSFESVLRTRLDELRGGETDAIINGGKHEVDAITDILREAEALNATRLGAEDCQEDSKSQEFLQHLDTYIVATIEKKKDERSSEIRKTDACIMGQIANGEKLEHKLRAIGDVDYSVIIVTLVKLYMKFRLENLAKKDATEKSDAAREALLAELALDSQKSGKGGTSNSKHAQDRTKGKKKHKDNRKPKDSKTGKRPLISQEIGKEDDSLPAASDDELTESEEIRKKLELEAEERKLEEFLQYQRQLEDGEKQWHLAEQREDAEGNQQVKTDEASLNEKQMQSTNLFTQPGEEDRVMEKSEDLSKDISSGDWTPVGRRFRRKGRQQKHLSKSSVAKFDKSIKEHQSETIRQLPAGEEEKFQADLKQAVCESLGISFQSHLKSPIATLKTSEHAHFSADEESFAHGDTGGKSDATEVIGTGLQNEAGEQNCFLNVIIQSLWHIRQFRDEFLERSPSEHAHDGDPCVACALYEILTALSLAATNVQREPVAPTSLRTALSNLHSDGNIFQKAQMNDASEVLAGIFVSLQKSFAHDCIVNSLFGMDTFELMICQYCGLESRHLIFTSCVRDVNARTLRMMKMMCPESSLDELLYLVRVIDRPRCDPDAYGCGKHNHIHNFLCAPPPVFTAVLGWQSASEDTGDIEATLAALSPEVDISVFYLGLHQKQRHRLVSVVCYYGEHYTCYAYNHDQGRWILYDDHIVKAIGSWEDIIAECKEGRLQPQVLFFEAVN